MTTKAVFAVGRFNPPSIGHLKLAEAVAKVAKREGADALIFPTRSEDAKKNPIHLKAKISFLKIGFASTIKPKDIIDAPEVRTPIEVLKWLDKKGYKDVIMVAGSDRIEAFDKLLNTYNGKDYNFDSIKVVSAGERDPDADGVEGMSGSKMRELAAKGKFEEFEKALPPNLRAGANAKVVYDAVRSGMGLNEGQINEDYSEEASEDDSADFTHAVGDEIPYNDGSTVEQEGEEADEAVDEIVAEVDGYIDALQDEDLSHLEEGYDAEFLATVLAEDGALAALLDADIKLCLTEAISKQERLSRGQRMRRMAQFLHAKLKLAQNRMPSKEQIDSRAKAMATNLMKAKIAKKPVADMTPAERERVEKIMVKLQGVVRKLALKLKPRIREIAKLRIANANNKQKGATK